MRLIAQYNPRFNPIVGGGETYISNLVESMKNYNFEIITNALPGHPLEEKFSENTLIRRFLPYDRSLIPFGNSALSKYSFPYRIMTDIIRIYRKNQFIGNSSYAIIHFHGMGFGGNLLRVDKWIKTLFLSKYIDFNWISIPKVLTIHNLFSPLTDNAIFEKYEHYIIDQFENIICVDKNIESYVNNYLKSKNQNKKISFIPNSVDLNRFSFSKIEQRKKLQIGFAGRFERSRGIVFLQKLIKNLPDFCELHLTCNPIQIHNNSNIHFYGSLPENKIPIFLKNIDILFNPVIAEGISRITLEAMSSGRSVIMLDKGNRHPIIHGKTGYLVKEDINDLINLLEHIKDNRDDLQKLGYNARKIVEDEFSNEVIIPKIEKIYEDLLNEN
ncbi:MAG: glycosyltransferase family 4 protein [Candidatus Methanoperedens sp.]|nr:glycosyltransferase family 4 protein [Candidatus Methanoperedens sp.]